VRARFSYICGNAICFKSQLPPETLRQRWQHVALFFPTCVYRNIDERILFREISLMILRIHVTETQTGSMFVQIPGQCAVEREFRIPGTVMRKVITFRPKHGMGFAEGNRIASLALPAKNFGRGAEKTSR